MLMQAEGLAQAAAFERLRQQARSQRRKLEDVAKTLVEQGPAPKP